VISYRSAGDAALLLRAGTEQDGNQAAALAAAIRAAALPGVVDVVPGACTVLVSVEPGSAAIAELATRLAQIRPLSAAGTAAGSAAGRAGAAQTAEIDVVYDGPDLADVAALCGLTVSQLIGRHQAAAYRVGWLGFSPGFGYLTGLDPVLAAVPRRASPRPSVPAGSVAIAGGLAAVYPSASPGGWQLLGRAAAPLWDPAADPPALLSPGMTVTFRAVEQLPAAPATTARSGQEGGTPGGKGQAPAALPGEACTASPDERLIRVIQPGPLTTVQDLGRAGLAHLGLPGSGAADAASLRRANRLAGNQDGAAALEVTLGRLAVQFGCDAVIALTGAPAPMLLTAGPVSAGPPAASGQAERNGTEVPPDTAITVSAGTTLRLGSPPAGLRSYLAIGGGIEVPPVLGSRSADLLSGVGPAPLRAGQLLPLGRPGARNENPRSGEPRLDDMPPLPGDPPILRAVAGPRDDWFTREAMQALRSGSYRVTVASNRTGLRLDGPPLPRIRAGELPSEGLATGSLQVTHDGQPILLLADHPVTGGYPVIAVVIAADLAIAAQLRPGQLTRFSLSPPVRGRR
jgi:KipI family sensor histidine kinase inhibitor